MVIVIVNIIIVALSDCTVLETEILCKYVH